MVILPANLPQFLITASLATLSGEINANDLAGLFIDIMP